jgi:hypothetical protein
MLSRQTLFTISQIEIEVVPINNYIRVTKREKN